ncbi:glycosyltransferase family 4 protein [Sinorhizobium sp. BJ1]|uniref:glycosyltransferase family 4 protein n=1 Tax=Sinorhizobium sp. BJ1 TaxID=2035455 RepID=UPI000BE8EA86|nr:glycosyltransferase family 4 protein [Sinorhizobium sp. BJ1]PDT83171.1 glycosyl transferase [Sinorhizobium sp. BJ1]
MSSQTAVSRDHGPQQTRGSATSIHAARGSGERFPEKLLSVHAGAAATTALLEGPPPGLDGAALSPEELDGFLPSLANTAARPRVMMLGLRGIPDVQGGVEKHVEMLSTRLVALGWSVDVIGRQRYLSKSSSYAWGAIRVFPLWAPRLMALEAIVHTFVGVCFAALRRPDVLHIHAIGPALLVPLARLLRMRVVVTHHGYDYDRQKWGTFAKRILKLGERMGMRLAHGRIAISKEIVKTMGERYKVPVAFVPNGVAVSPGRAGTGILNEFGLTRRRYILLAARLVPEKRQTDLVQAFARLGDNGVKLVLAGSAEFETPYADEVRAMADSVPDVVMTGFQSGDRLAELFANAALFVLPSSHEGMPIALLEAMAHGLPVLASDIVANRELGLPAADYFPLGDIDALAAAIARKIANPPSDDEVRSQMAHVESTHSWASVAQKTLAIYRALAR